MKKIKGLVVRKSWAKQAREAMRRLRPPTGLCDPSPNPDNGAITHGFTSGCCNALSTYAAREGFKRFIDPSDTAIYAGYWWPTWHSKRPTVALRGYNARIIALESFALYCEEHGV